MQDIAFRPTEITVTTGETVTWRNDENVPHTTASRGQPLWESPILNQGQSFSYTFMNPGTYDYWCTIHPDMLAQVIVR